MYRRIQPATKRCEQVGTVKDKCGMRAAGNWDLTTGKRIKTKWLCLGHAIYWGVNRNPQQAVFEEVAK
jgi:hypothetical protein